jgi:hypothetical protein
MQRELQIMQIVGGKPQMVVLHRHDGNEIATCETFGEAMRLAQIHCRTKAYELARACGVRKSLVSAWQLDSRMPKPHHLMLYMQATASAAPLQWLCGNAGGEFHFEPRKAAAALLRAQADEIERAA